MNKLSDLTTFLSEKEMELRQLALKRTYESELDDEGPDEFSLESIFGDDTTFKNLHEAL